jgi:hypothetical protein
MVGGFSTKYNVLLDDGGIMLSTGCDRGFASRSYRPYGPIRSWSWKPSEGELWKNGIHIWFSQFNFDWFKK